MIDVILNGACGIPENGVNRLHLRGDIVSLPDEAAKNLIERGAAKLKAEETVKTAPVKAEKESKKSDAETDVDSMSVSELRKFAKDNNIDIGSARSKADLLIAIKSFREGDVIIEL